MIPTKQGKGVGTKFIELAKRKKGHLSVGVYDKNTDAKRFYIKNGFTYQGEEVQAETGELVINMVFK